MLCKLLSHHNYKEITESTDDYDIIHDDAYDWVDERRIKYKKPTYYFDENIFGDLTGPDGGFPSEWSCNCCESIILLDK